MKNTTWIFACEIIFLKIITLVQMPYLFNFLKKLNAIDFGQIKLIGKQFKESLTCPQISYINFVGYFLISTK